MKLKPNLLFEVETQDETELKKIVEKLASALEKNSILLLSGDLGAGKTTTVRYLCENYGLHSVQSPTYAIHQRYENSIRQIDHFDLYRLQSEDELMATGFWDLLQENKGLVLIEWFEKISDPSWLEAETAQRKIFGLKIEVKNTGRNFKFFELC